MSSKDAHLYGLPRNATKPAKKPLASSSDLAFSTALSSLISSSAATTTSSTDPQRVRKRPRGKDDIFTTHNRNAKKRALADEAAAQDDPASEARWKGKDAPVDDAAWKRAKRKMEHKARLYAALKRGDVADDGEDDNPRHMVDFDRKWAEKQDTGGGSSGSDDDDDDDDGSDEEEELVEYVDNFGRTRKGTRAEAAREQRRMQTAQRLRDEEDKFSARPKQPTNVIFGDTIQTAAFNPDEPVAAQMEELAKKRDRELTPPEAVHYDASAEIRNRGTGFFQFSKDEEERKRQMENLEKERKETERVRAEKEQRDSRKEERAKEIEERRRRIKEKRGQRQAEEFLESLGNEMASRNNDET